MITFISSISKVNASLPDMHLCKSIERVLKHSEELSKLPKNRESKQTKIYKEFLEAQHVITWDFLFAEITESQRGLAQKLSTLK